jgi:hypothetical protein
MFTGKKQEIQMNNITMKNKYFWSMVIAVFMAVSFQATAVADIVTTEQILVESKVEAKKVEIGALLQRSDVRQQLVGMGVDVSDAQQRIDSMTDSELAAFYEKMDILPAGEGALELVIAILLIFILLDVAGVTDIFPGI